MCSGKEWLQFEPNGKGNPAAAKNLQFQKTPGPPLGLTALLASLFARSNVEVRHWFSLRVDTQSHEGIRFTLSIVVNAQGAAEFVEVGEYLCALTKKSLPHFPAVICGLDSHWEVKTQLVKYN